MKKTKWLKKVLKISTKKSEMWLKTEEQAWKQMAAIPGHHMETSLFCNDHVLACLAMSLLRAISYDKRRPLDSLQYTAKDGFVLFDAAGKRIEGWLHESLDKTATEATKAKANQNPT